MLLDSTPSLHSPSRHCSRGVTTSASPSPRTSALDFAVVPKLGTSLSELMAPRQTPPEKNGAYPPLEHVIKAEDNYHFVPNDASSEGGALLPQDATVEDCDDWLDRVQYPRKRRPSLVSWASTTVEAARDSSDDDFDFAPLPARGSYRAPPGPPPYADDASFTQTPALSSPRTFSESTGPFEHPSPPPRGSTWSVLADSSGDDVEPDPDSDAQRRVPERLKAKVVCRGSGAPRARGKKSTPRPSAKAHPPNTRSAKDPTAKRRSPKDPTVKPRFPKAPSAKHAAKAFKCRYINPDGEQCKGSCGKLYDLARHMVTVHGRWELDQVVLGSLVHHPDGSPIAEGEKHASLLGALWPRLNWPYLHQIGLATYDFKPLHWLECITKLYPCWALGCPSEPFGRSDSLWKHLREQHDNRTRAENDAMQPPDYDPTHVNKERVLALFGTPVVPSASPAFDETDAVDFAPARRLSVRSGSRIKREGPSPRVPLLPVDCAPELPRPTRSSRKHEASPGPKHVTFNVPGGLERDFGLSSSPKVHAPVLLPTELPSPAQKPRILGTPEQFTAHLPRSPLHISTLPLVDETAALQAQLDGGSWQPTSSSHLHLPGSFTAMRSPQAFYSPALSTPGVLPHPVLPDASNLSPAAPPMPIHLSPQMPEQPLYYVQSDELARQTGSLGLDVGLTVTPSQLSGAEPYAEPPIYNAGPSWEAPMQQDTGFFQSYAPQFTSTSPFRAGAAVDQWLSPPAPTHPLLDPASGDPSPRSPLAHIPDAVVPHYSVDGFHDDSHCVTVAGASHVERVMHHIEDGTAASQFGGESYQGMDSEMFEAIVDYNACA